MSKKLAMTPTIKSSNLSTPEKVACPKCDASLIFYRSNKPHIDECGFESYSFKCRACRSMLVGIIDPADDTLTSDDLVVKSKFPVQAGERIAQPGWRLGVFSELSR